MAFSFTARHASHKCEVGDYVTLYDDNIVAAHGYVTDYSAHWHETEYDYDKGEHDGYWEYHWISLGVEWDGDTMVRELRHTAFHSYWSYAVEQAHNPLRLYYVNFYHMQQQYGGREEGGWWYVHGSPVATHSFALRSEAFAFAHGKGDEMVEGLNEGRPPISSTLSNGIYGTKVETKVGRAYPRERPHYS